MALLWCAHDVQLTFARNSRLVKNPFGNVTPFESPTTLSSFLDSSYCVLTPSTVVETARPRYESLLEVLTMRNRQEKEQARFLKRRASKDISFRRAYNQARWIYARTDREMLVGLVDAQIGRVPGLIEDFKQQNPFWRHLAGDVPRRPVPTFAHLCFSGLTVLQANAVAILRFCQVERQLERLVQEGLTPRKGKKPRQLTSIPAYRKLDKASMTRARNLLHAYRRGYPDKDFDSVSKGSDGVLESGEMRDLRGIGQTALDRAETFLCGLGRRRLGDNHGPLESVRRTFYLLDVIPDIRLCR
jgi:hypothetical protein